jgi:cob(I)alamin adenosyltransferase
MDDTATPETGPVGASDDIDDIVSEIGAGEPQSDATDEVVAELVKDTEEEGQPETDPEAEESATDPIDEAEEPEEAPPSEDDPTYTVKVNGEEQAVPLSELLKGYSRTEDYKAKTMALADERRQVEAQKATIEQDVKLQYANELKTTIDMFEALDPVLSEARQIDWDRLKAEDPATFVQYSDAVNQRLQLIEQHREKIKQAEQVSVEQSQREFAQRLDTAANKIVEAMPELATEESFQRFATDNIGYLRETGFTPDEINDALDERTLMLADKARRWDALQRAKKGLPANKIVPKSAVKPMKSDASDSSRSSKPRFPANASREARGDWIAEQILNSE